MIMGSTWDWIYIEFVGKMFHEDTDSSNLLCQTKVNQKCDQIKVVLLAK